jgi:hypothetical protein
MKKGQDLNMPSVDSATEDNLTAIKVPAPTKLRFATTKRSRWDSLMHNHASPLNVEALKSQRINPHMHATEHNGFPTKDKLAS